MNYSQLDFTKLKVANYNRKSSESEDKQMLSIISQLEEAQRIKEYYKLADFIEIFEEAKSAKKENNRPKFTEMIEMIKNGKMDTILCWKLDRLARNMTEGGMIIDLLSSGVIKAIITHDKVYYPSDNVLLMSVEFGQSNQFIKDLSVNVKRGQTKKAEMGLPHGVATLGFLNDKTEGKGNRKWLVDNDRFWKIQKLFEMFLTGNYSAGKLYKYAINDLKLTTVKRKRIGGELIQLSRIYEILTDPIYAGFFYYGGERYNLNKELPRLITESDHNKVKQLLSRNNIPKTQHHDTPYAGFIKSDKGETMGVDTKFQLICDCKKKFAYRDKTECPYCGAKISELENPKYIHKVYYYNVKKKKAGEKYKSVEINQIEESLSDLINNNLSFSNDLLEWSKKYIYELKEKEVVERITISKDKEIRKEEYVNKKSKLRSLLRDEKITDEEYNFDLKQLDKEYADTKIENQNKDWFNEMMDILDIAKESSKIFALGNDIKAKKEILSKLGSNLVWNEENLFICNKKSINKLVEGIKGIKSEFPEFEPKNFLVNKDLNEKTDEFSPVFSTMLRG